MSNRNIEEILGALSGEKVKVKGSDVEKIRNLLESDNELSKIVDLPKLSELIDRETGKLSGRGRVLIERAFENGFTGIHTDAAGITDIKVLENALGEINEIAREKKADYSNYVSFKSVDEGTDVDAETINRLSEEYKFTPVIKIGEKGEEIMPQRVSNAIKGIRNAAVEIEGITTGD